MDDQVQKSLSQYRKTEFDIDPLFRDRWSPRAMSGEELSHDELMALFEAARWAPSSYNNQPWRFIYAVRSSSQWSAFFSLLGEFNQSWCKNAAALIVIVGKKTFDNGKPSITYQLDTGAAWENLALQASRNGLVGHGMQGFDYAKARQALEIPDDYEVLAMAAVGRAGRKEDLPKELQERETPSDRKPVAEIAFQGRFGGAR